MKEISNSQVSLPLLTPVFNPYYEIADGLQTYHVCDRPNVSNAAHMRSSASERSYKYFIDIPIEKYLYYESVIHGIYV
jgi:hypothetical protein